MDLSRDWRNVGQVLWNFLQEQVSAGTKASIVSGAVC